MFSNPRSNARRYDGFCSSEEAEPGDRQGRAFFDRDEGEEELVWPSGRMLDESGRRFRRDEKEFFFFFFFVEIKWLTLVEWILSS